jgi:hypothetical protein
VALLATPFARREIRMPEMRPVRTIPPVPFTVPDETARLFHVALHDVVRHNAISMADLRECVKACARSLRESSVGPAQMIVSMKACAREANKKYPATLNGHDSANVDFLMEHIVKWAIIEYYSDA